MKQPTKTDETKRDAARDKLLRRSVSQGRTVDEIAAAVRAAGLPRSSRASVARDVAALRGRQKVRRVDAKRAPAPAPAPAPDGASEDGLPSDAQLAAETSLEKLSRWLDRADALAKLGEASDDRPLQIRAADLATKILSVRLRVDPPPPPPRPLGGHDGDAAREKILRMCEGMAAQQKHLDDVTASELPARLAAGATGPGPDASPREEGMWIGIRTMRGEAHARASAAVDARPR